MIATSEALAHYAWSALVSTSLIWPGFLPAQRPPAHARTYVHQAWTVENGLPVNSINGLLQSRDGYIWAATWDGLVRFDGIRFTVFNAANTEGLPSNRFVLMLEDRNGVLWLRTESEHVVRFHQGRFTHIDKSRGLVGVPRSLTMDSSGVVWLTTDRGIGRLEGDRFIPVAPGEIIAPGGGVVRRRDGSTWIGTRGHGTWRLIGGRAERVMVGTILDSIVAEPMIEDKSGRLWIGGQSEIVRVSGDSVRRFVPSALGVPCYSSAGGSQCPLGKQLILVPSLGAVVVYGSAGVYRLTDSEVVSIDARRRIDVWTAPITVDSFGAFWFATADAVYRNGQLAWKPTGDPTQSGPSRITALLVDREGSIWFGTEAAGLHQLKPGVFSSLSEAEGLAHRNVYPVYRDPAGNIWAGMWGGGGFSRIEPNGTIRNFTIREGYPGANSFLSDKPDRLWVAASEGPSMGRIIACSLPSMRCTRDPSPDAQQQTAYALFQDGTGRLWAGTRTGLLQYDGSRWSAVPGLSKPAHIRAFQETKDGTLWMGTNGSGLLRYRDGVFASVTTADGLPGDFVRSLYLDVDGWLWVGTEGRGLARLDPKAWDADSRADRRRIVAYRTRDGLFDDVIHQILEDADGRLWMSSNRGIFWVARSELDDFASGRVRQVHSTSYTERDGLRNREANGGIQPAGARGGDGRLWFPTQDGLAIVDPSEVRSSRAAPPVVVERIRAAGSELVPGDAPVSLGARQRDLEIDYTAPTFLEPGTIRFRYRLDPYDRDWVDVGSRRTAYYTKVPPGRYTFRVAAGGNAAPTGDGARVEITVAAQFWETNAFRLAVIVTALLAAFASARWWRQRFERRARALELVVDERTGALREHQHQLAVQNATLTSQAERLSQLDEVKSRFFANVSHELRTPLTLTIGPLEDLREELGSAASARVDMALRNARRLLRLVNQILDVAKLEAGQMKLHRRRLDLAALARGLAGAFQQVAESKGIALVVTTPDTVTGAFDADAVEKILTNLLSNAVKFTPADGRVALTLSRRGGSVGLVVSDTGPGIPAAHLPHVFERFYQVDESGTRAEPGTGIGLSLVKELVELHGGQVTVAGDSGATFTIVLPLGDVDLASAEATMVTEHVLPPDESSFVEERRNIESEDVPTLLVVDDSADLRRYVRGHFEPRFRVLEAGDGAEGVAIAQRELPDLILSDVMMPGTDGHELCRRLRASAETDFIPIILLTAQAGAEQRIAGLERGADDFIVKPFEMRELATRVDNLIASRRRLRERFQRVDPSSSASDAMSGEIDALAPADRTFVERVRAAVDAGHANPDFGVAELAYAVAQDRSHLFRRTRQILGESPSDLIRRVRLEHAARLLETDVGTVADVAYAVGFNSVSHFYRCFQAAFGATPIAYRERAARS